MLYAQMRKIGSGKYKMLEIRISSTKVKNVNSFNKTIIKCVFMKIIKKLKTVNKNVDIDMSEIIAICCTWVSMSRILVFIIIYTEQKQPVKISLLTLIDYLVFLRIYLNEK